MIEGIVKEVEVGEVYEGTVKRIMDFGAFVEILPGKEGLVHISQLASERVAKVEDVVTWAKDRSESDRDRPAGPHQLVPQGSFPTTTDEPGPRERIPAAGAAEGGDGRGGRGPARERGRGPGGPGRGARR